MTCICSVSTERTQEKHQAEKEDWRKHYTKVQYEIQHQGKMNILLLIFLVCGTSAESIMPELKCNVLRFGYGVNSRYEGMLAHLFDRFYVVTGKEIP